MHACNLLDIPKHPLLLVANTVAPCICMQSSRGDPVPEHLEIGHRKERAVSNDITKSCMQRQERPEQSVLSDHAT